MNPHGRVNVRWKQYDDDGTVVAEGATHNETTEGLGELLGAAILHDSPTATPASHMAIGTGGTPAKPTDTALDAEVHRVAIGSSTDNGTSLDLTATFPSGASGDELIREAALFTASSGGTMLNRVTLETEHFIWDGDTDITATLAFRTVLGTDIQTGVASGGATVEDGTVETGGATDTTPPSGGATVPSTTVNTTP